MSDPNQNLPDGNYVPSTSTPIPTNVILQLFRALILIAGTCGLTVPAALQSESTLANIAGVVALVIGLAWQAYASWVHARQTHNAAVVSAAMKAPMQVR